MLPKRKDAVAWKKTVKSIGLLSGLFIIILSLELAVGACSQSETPEKATGKATPAAESSRPKLYEASRINCSLFTREDAAAILGLPAAEIQVDAQEGYAGNWQCGYKGGSFEKMVNFNVSRSKSVEEAVADMAQYRGHLDVAKNVKPFKDDLENGAYSDISGVGDDALWTAVNGTLSVRKGNVSLQVQLPKGKDTQIRVAKEFLSRLESEE